MKIINCRWVAPLQQQPTQKLGLCAHALFVFEKQRVAAPSTTTTTAAAAMFPLTSLIFHPWRVVLTQTRSEQAQQTDSWKLKSNVYSMQGGDKFNASPLLLLFLFFGCLDRHTTFCVDWNLLNELAFKYIFLFLLKLSNLTVTFCNAFQAQY